MAAVQAIMIPNSQGIRTLEVNSPRSGSPPSLTYSPGSVGTLSSSASSPSAVSLKTASSSLSTPTTPDSTEQTVRKRPSFIRRKPVPRLTLEEELALLDDESRRLDNSIQTTPVIPGYGLLPALELLAKQKAELPVRPLFSVVPDPPSFAMTRSDVKTLKPSITPKIVATTENEEPHSPIPPESPSVSEVAIQWYTTPVSDKTNNKRFRIPSDAAEACGSPEMKCGAPASCRSTLVETLHVPEEETEHTSAQLSEYDSDELDEEKRASILTDTFDPRGHTHRCTTGRCSIGSVALDSQHDGSDNDTDDESRDYVSIIPVPILRKARSTDSQVAEETDFLDESVRLSEYRWLPKRFVDPKDGRKRTCQSYSTTNTETFPRSRTPTYEQDAISFVTAQELPRTPSMLHEEETFATPHISTVAQPPRAFLSTSPSLASSRSDSISSNAATIDSDLYNDRSSVFESPNVRAGLFIRESIQSSSSDSAVDAYRATLPGRKISLSASPGGSYTTATMRWDRNLSMSQKEGTMVTRRPSTADNPCYVNVVPPPPVNYQNKRPHTAPVTSQKDESRTSHGMPQSRSKAFALVMRELLALHEASIRARHEAARIKAEKRAAAKQALQLYTYQRPETEAMEQAADCMVYTSTGKEVRFGDLYEGARTIVCFIRHYWCPSCQDYLTSIMRVEPAELRALNLQLIIIGCGNWKMIEGYRKALNGCDFPIYSDPTRQVYRHFGMHMSTMAAGPKPAYTKHGMTINTLVSIKRNTAMPLKNPGDLNGLGGEFVVGPGKTECIYAHRMKNTRDHAELVDILKAIGTSAPKQLQVKPETVRRARSAEEIRQDQVQRRAERIRQKRARMLKPGRVVVRVRENPHTKEYSVETIE